VKSFSLPFFEEHHLCTAFAEQVYSTSHRNVIRGLHFQIPPEECVKLVHCVAGKVTDVVVDLRAGSPTYGKYALFELNEEQANEVYVPAGLAHGFYVHSDSATVVYGISRPFSPTCDSGIRWDSADIPWPTTTPDVSVKDRNLPPLSSFNSPFLFSS